MNNTYIFESRQCGYTSRIRTTYTELGEEQAKSYDSRVYIAFYRISHRFGEPEMREYAQSAR